MSHKNNSRKNNGRYISKAEQEKIQLEQSTPEVTKTNDFGHPVLEAKSIYVTGFSRDIKDL